MAVSKRRAAVYIGTNQNLIKQLGDTAAGSFFLFVFNRVVLVRDLPRGLLLLVGRARQQAHRRRHVILDYCTLPFRFVRHEIPYIVP